MILYDKQYVLDMDKICEIRMNTLPFSSLKYLQTINPSFLTITKLSSNEIRETFCKGLK